MAGASLKPSPARGFTITRPDVLRRVVSCTCPHTDEVGIRVARMPGGMRMCLDEVHGGTGLEGLESLVCINVLSQGCLL